MSDRTLFRIAASFAFLAAALRCGTKPPDRASNASPPSTAQASANAPSPVAALTDAVDSSFFPDGYYAPLDDLRVGSYRLSYFGLLTRYSHDSTPRPLGHSVRVALGWLRDSTAFFPDSMAHSECASNSWEEKSSLPTGRATSP